MPAPKTKKAEIEERRKRVAVNLQAGLDYRAMAEAFGVSIGTICSDVKAIFKAWQKEQAHIAGGYIALELKRIDKLINSLWSLALADPPNFAAIDRIMALMTMRAKYLGIAPQKLEVTGKDGAALTGPVYLFTIPDNGRGDSQAPFAEGTGSAETSTAGGDNWPSTGAADAGA